MLVIKKVNIPYDLLSREVDKMVSEQYLHSDRVNRNIYSNFNLVKEFPSLHVVESLVRAEILKLHPENNDVTFLKSWMNVMYDRSYINEHIHHETVSGVAILYYKVPENSARFYPIIDGVVKEIIVEENTIVIHDATVRHSVGVHSNSEFRICFVFNYLLT